MLKFATEAVSLSNEWLETSPYKEQWFFVRELGHAGATGDRNREDDLSELTWIAEVNRRMIVKLKECCCQAKQDDDRRRIIVQQIMQKSAEFLRRDHPAS